MKHSKLMVSALFVASLQLVPCAVLSAAESPSGNPPNMIGTLGGEVGEAASASIRRFRAAPYDSLAWLRADLTGERVTEFDGKWGHIMNRPFKNYSGDISGRFIEIMAPCPTLFLRRNRLGDGVDMVRQYKERSVLRNGADTKEVAVGMEGDIVVGTFVDRERPTWLEAMNAHFSSVLGDRYRTYGG